MKIGLVGLPKSGKTTLFNLLTGASVATSRYDAGRSEMHTGVARVPDPRVDRLSALFKPKKTTYATFEVVDLAGIEKGERTALDAKEFRNADALLHVVRAFSDEARGSPDPRRDILDLELELIFADLEVVDRRVERLEVSIKKQRKDAEVQEHAVLTRLKAALEAASHLAGPLTDPGQEPAPLLVGRGDEAGANSPRVGLGGLATDEGCPLGLIVVLEPVGVDQARGVVEPEAAPGPKSRHGPRGPGCVPSPAASTYAGSILRGTGPFVPPARGARRPAREAAGNEVVVASALEVCASSPPLADVVGLGAWMRTASANRLQQPRDATRRSLALRRDDRVRRLACW